MKKLIVLLAFLLLVGCEEKQYGDDGENPVVMNVLGEEHVTVELGKTFTDPGVELINSELLVDGEVDTSTLGTYTLKYSDTYGYTSGLRTVEVIDTVAPVVKFKSKNVELFEDEGYESILYEVTDADDNVDVVIEEYMDSSGNPVLYYTATDSSGNSKTYELNFEIVSRKEFDLKHFHIACTEVYGDNVVFYDGYGFYDASIDLFDPISSMNFSGTRMSAKIEDDEHRSVFEFVLKEGDNYIVAGSMFGKSSGDSSTAHPVAMLVTPEGENVWVTDYRSYKGRLNRIEPLETGYALMYSKVMPDLLIPYDEKSSVQFVDKMGNVTYEIVDTDELFAINVGTHEDKIYVVIEDASNTVSEYHINIYNIDGELLDTVEFGYDKVLSVASADDVLIMVKKQETGFVLISNDESRLITLDNDNNTVELKKFTGSEYADYRSIDQIESGYLLSSMGANAKLIKLDNEFNVVDEYVIGTEDIHPTIVHFVHDDKYYYTVHSMERSKFYFYIKDLSRGE